MWASTPQTPPAHIGAGLYKQSASHPLNTLEESLDLLKESPLDSGSYGAQHPGVVSMAGPGLSRQDSSVITELPVVSNS
jgi:hypothetical protein